MPDVKIAIPCRLCDDVTTLTVPADAFAEWAKGNGHVQVLFPDLTVVERELMISRTCGPCWDRLFPPDPDDLVGPNPQEAEFGPQVQWSNLPGGVKAIALNAGDHYRGSRWYRQDGPDRVYLAFRGDPAEFVGAIKAPRVG